MAGTAAVLGSGALRPAVGAAATGVDPRSIATLNAAPGDSAFTFDLTGPFDANVTYRVTYQSCTPDGQIDPSGTTYDNTAQIEGWGTAGEGIGTRPCIFAEVALSAAKSPTRM